MLFGANCKYLAEPLLLCIRIAIVRVSRRPRLARIGLPSFSSNARVASQENPLRLVSLAILLIGRFTRVRLLLVSPSQAPERLNGRIRSSIEDTHSFFAARAAIQMTGDRFQLRLREVSQTKGSKFLHRGTFLPTHRLPH